MKIRVCAGLFAFAVVASGLAVRANESAPPPNAPPIESEKPDQPPAAHAARDNLAARSPGQRVATGPYVSVQVNVDASGHNIVGDAANEPSIAVNPKNRSNMVIGWRQFDSVTSNFRQAGWAYTFNKGASWTFPGSLNPGVFRSDPVVDVNSSGEFFYQSLKGDDLIVGVYKSSDGGVTWGAPAYGFGGDKNWLVVDRSGGPTDGNIYGTWQPFVSCCEENILTRSIDDGETFSTPVSVAGSPHYGQLAVGPDGTLFSAGIEGVSSHDFFHPVIAWPQVGGGLAPPFSVPGGRRIDLGGSMSPGANPAPNPGGLNGQINVAVDQSGATTAGNVYVLASVYPAGTSSDPQDVHFIRSEDNARSFSAPVRVNDDLDNNFQWFGAHAVAPTGRIDAIWFDTRDVRVVNASRLYYAYSWDAGATWSANVPVSPAFNSWSGWPNQSKIGDYMSIVSDATGADVAYPATFNDEQDVYYVRLFPDCNGNGISDVTDLAAHTSQDCNLSHIPDECETAPACAGAGSVPDGGPVPGSPLTIDKGQNDTIALSWGASCLSADGDYAVYEGTLGDFGSHQPRACSTIGARTFTLSPAAADAYYLIVPVHADREGSYGTDGTGIERPPSISACAARALHACGG